MIIIIDAYDLTSFYGAEIYLLTISFKLMEGSLLLKKRLIETRCKYEKNMSLNHSPTTYFSFQVLDNIYLLEPLFLYLMKWR